MIEIDEVFEASSVSGARCGCSALKIDFLVLFVLGGRLDREVGLADGRKPLCGVDADEAASRFASVIAPVDLAARLPRITSGAAAILLGDVVEQHVVAGQGADMRDAAAHLARADHADALDIHEFKCPVW